MTSSAPSPNLHPVRDASGDAPKSGIALCLSGGGYRAMVFHLGAIWRLNELGLLGELKRVSSVSGGSITAGYLGYKWTRLTFDARKVATNLVDEVISPVMALAGHTIDVPSVIAGAISPFNSIADDVACAYREFLFGNATLQDLPSDDEGPRFVLNATSVQTKADWRFSRPFMGDYRVGLIPNPTLELAIAVGASSAFPPVLSPVKLKFDPAAFQPTVGADLQKPPYTTNVMLTDGGVYDNLGLETAWKAYDTILVSDGGAATPDDPHPHADWALHAIRVMQLLDNQVGALRKRMLIGAYELGLRKGTYWGIGSDIANYGLDSALPFPFDDSIALAATPTRLHAMDAPLQQRLVNWGYAICDAAIRRHVVDPAGACAPKFPFGDGAMQAKLTSAR